MANADDGKQVLRVDQDSETDLQALFDSVLKPDSKRPLQVPWSMRKLPDSFFNPPSTGSKSINHSRENSVDSAFGSAGSNGSASGAPLPAAHHRAHSSPASLQQTYAVGQTQPPTHHHIKQRSYDVAAKVEDSAPLPAGWEQARTAEGQLYYLNHITRTTTWEDPRKSLAVQQQQQHQSAEQLLTHQITQATNAATPAKVNADVDLGPLPEGWEQAQTAEAQHLQQRTGGGAGPGWHATVGSSPAPAPLAQSSPAKQQQFRLQMLQTERDRLKQRQREIHLMMGRGSSDLQIDPFLTGINDHSRQESADSGLGLGPAYSMPQTPEDFLANMDDNMEVGSESHTMDTPDMSSLSDNIDCSDDLEPSLQLSELGEEFPTVILDEDVQSLINTPTTKPDNALIWL